jgi:hypothetical protein
MNSATARSAGVYGAGALVRLFFFLWRCGEVDLGQGWREVVSVVRSCEVKAGERGGVERALCSSTPFPLHKPCRNVHSVARLLDYEIIANNPLSSP